EVEQDADTVERLQVCVAWAVLDERLLLALRMFAAERDVEKLLIVGEPGFGRMILGGAAGGVLQHERLQILPASVVQVAVQIRSLIGEPADGETARLRSAAAGEPDFRLGGIVPGALLHDVLEAAVPIDAAEALAEIALGGLQAELDRRIGSIERTKRGRRFPNSRLPRYHSRDSSRLARYAPRSCCASA